MDRYDEALERARAGKSLEEIFPELKESEDERIRKWLIAEMKTFHNQAEECGVQEDMEMTTKAIAYLEKHKEQKPAEWSEEDEKMFESLHTCVCRCINDYRFDYAEREQISRKLIPFIERLKSLRPQPHWKPDVEDYKALNRAIEMADELGESNTCEILKGLRMELKSIHPFSWKPSEEQMKALNKVANEGVLLDLFNDLIKLL